ncbi:MAG: AmmeMemoRadiSam system protein B, partial [Deltaproteobacteria bacterium]
KTMAEEHSIYGPVALIKRTLPNTRVLPIILKNNLTTSSLDVLIDKLQEILPADAVIVSSIDFSHYQNVSVADFHDELSKAVIENFDYEKLPQLEIDSTPSLYVLMKLMEKRGSQKILNHFHSNSGVLAGNNEAENTTSHFVFFFGSGEKENKKYFSLLHFGDMMLDRNVKKKIDENGFDYLLKNLAGEENRFFSGTNIFMANLEGPFANFRRQTSKSIAFRFEPKLIPELKKYHLTLFSLANNHTLDMGLSGFAEAKDNLTKEGIEFFGRQVYTGTDSLLLKDLGKAKVGFIGLDDTIKPVDAAKAEELIAEAKGKKADFVLVSIHWGEEYQLLKSNKRQQALAHLLIEAGADAVIGHHPHVVQEMEIYKNKPIFYSLGNFIFDQYFSLPTQ